MNEMNDELNDAIERNLRDAHQQVNFRPEWAERVMFEIACEVERESNANSIPPIKLVQGCKQTGKSRPSKSWMGVSAIAAVVLLAISFRLFFSPSSPRNVSVNVIDSKEPPNAQKEPTEKWRDEQPIAKLQHSVVAAPGYLAARLSDEPEFEIYVVLPTRIATKTD